MVILTAPVFSDIAVCVDRQGEACIDWALQGQCESNKDGMMHSCMKTCKLCPQCHDEYQDCSTWASKGECEKNPQMHKYCRQSCKDCSEATSQELARDQQQMQTAMAEADAAVAAGTQSADSIPKNLQDVEKMQAQIKKANAAAVSGGRHEEDEQPGEDFHVNWSRVIGLSGLGAIACFFYKGGQRKLQTISVLVQHKVSISVAQMNAPKPIRSEIQLEEDDSSGEGYWRKMCQGQKQQDMELCDMPSSNEVVTA